MIEAADRDLLAAAEEGVADAVGVLFDRHARSVYNFLFHRTADWSVAEDLTSAVFLEAWRHRDVQLVRQSALPWLLGVATNLLRNHRRALRRYEAALARVPEPEPQADPAEELAGRVDEERRMRRVNDLVSQLSAADQEVLALCVWARLSYTEAADALDVPVGTVRSRLSRARARLKELTGESGHHSDERPIARAAIEPLEQEW
jgi:RNA polymerase sigma factor (sigma-70 family)